MEDLRECVDKLNRYLSQTEKDRHLTPLANDVYEAAWYWRDLGQWVLEKNTKINFPARAKEEQSLLDHLRVMVGEKSVDEQRHYQPIFEAASEILGVAADTLPPRDGHMGILRTLHANFDFLTADYAFQVVDEQPLGVKYSSDSVWIDLKYAERTSQCCTFGPENGSKDAFWPEDLLFMNGDERYIEIQQESILHGAQEVERWFDTLSELIQTYGPDVLTNRPGIFTRLADAQTRRDAELTKAMDSQYG